jgi:predicted nucleic acid-binding protein
LVEVDIGRVIALATERGVYAYDGYMLELARSRGLPLLTLDVRLSAAARAAGIDVLVVW